MQPRIIVQSYNSIPFDDKEIYRYLGQKQDLNNTSELILSCKQKAALVIQPKLCFRTINREIINEFVNTAKDTAFEKYFENCDEGILFAATLGFGFDRLLLREEKQSMSSALILQAIGAQQTEELCNIFCNEMKANCPGMKPRFSPGYGGLTLEAQKKIFMLLDCQRKIGLSLNESLLMSPIKSVTAFIAISKQS